MDAVLIAGPTASGKSQVALALARQLGAVIVNADSMQVYRELRILTARPSSEDERSAPHRLYGHVSVRQRYSVAAYLSDAVKVVADAGDRPLVFVGGTGLYFHALVNGLADIPPIPPEIREGLQRRLALEGVEALHAVLAACDPEMGDRLRPTDTQRILRALEVFEATGRPLGEWQRQPHLPGPLGGLALARFVLAPDRAELYRRINRRVETMLANGAQQEAASLRGLPPSAPGARALGLAELWAVQDGRISLADATAGIQLATRHYAKRQLTWFRNRMADWQWIDDTEAGNIISKILPKIP